MATATCQPKYQILYFYELGKLFSNKLQCLRFLYCLLYKMQYLFYYIAHLICFSFEFQVCEIDNTSKCHLIASRPLNNFQLSHLIMITRNCRYLLCVFFNSQDLASHVDDDDDDEDDDKKKVGFAVFHFSCPKAQLQHSHASMMNLFFAKIV